ncbi:hypothetical protein B2J93_1891 [Marssonina coronariae]|uniref:C2H2-type domain-containing protein n=1 Tax=Diplocarpon coronariae TaxID=2795749 RepID=A0A218Z3J8_9HELO|nr:hypothetical protein B2J93_1891 [Marssonina coronariae]
MSFGGNTPRISAIRNDGPYRGPHENPLLQWYTGNDGPWNPIPKATTESAVEDRPLSKQMGHRNNISYSSQYRQQNPVETENSQFGGSHSDSGYGTRCSVGNISVFSADVHESDHDSHSIAGLSLDYPPCHGVLQVRDSRTNDSRMPPSGHASDSPGLVCPACNKTVKTNSELNAEFRENSGILDQGESTPLPQMVWPQLPVVQDSLSRQRRDPEWKLLSPETDRSRDLFSLLGPQPKVFSTLPENNFLQCEEQRYTTIQSLEVLSDPPHIHRNRMTLDSLILSPWSNIDPPLKKAEEVRPEVIPQGQAPRLAQPAADAALTEVIQEALTRANISDPSPARRKAESESSSLPPGRGAVREVPSPHTAQDIECQKKAVEVLSIIRDLGFTVCQDPAQAPKTQNPGSAASNKSEHQVTCPQKHMKRHSRPYGCTFLSCSKSFGSKNDWKRHENSQHFHLETWRCDIPRLDESRACAKVYYRKQTFVEHLKKEHAFPATSCASPPSHSARSAPEPGANDSEDEAAIKAKLDACRIGRSCQSPFWCGFCAALVTLKLQGIEAWGERFDHIDDHFMGRGEVRQQGIGEWVPVGRVPGSGYGSGSELEPSNRGERFVASRSRSENASGHVHGKRGSDAISGGVDRPAKKPRTSKTHDTVIYCCQCKMQHNARLNRCCTLCEDSHYFCSACVVEAVRIEG